MTLTLEVPQDLEAKLAREAARWGESIEQYVLRRLSALRAEAPGKVPKTGAELVRYWEREGVIGSRPDIEDGPTYARQIRRQASRRQL